MQWSDPPENALPSRPAPIRTEDNQFFWDAAAHGQLVAQRCRGCGRLHHPPRPMCPECHSLDHEIVELSGTGQVYSYAVLHHPRNPKFAYPLVAALVELDEGIRMVTNLVGIEPADVRIGMPVQVAFEKTEDDRRVPVFEVCETG
jgi:uncharacterized OB-fold protein